MLENPCWKGLPVDDYSSIYRVVFKGLTPLQFRYHLSLSREESYFHALHALYHVFASTVASSFLVSSTIYCAL